MFSLCIFGTTQCVTCAPHGQTHSEGLEGWVYYRGTLAFKLPESCCGQTFDLYEIKANSELILRGGRLQKDLGLGPFSAFKPSSGCFNSIFQAWLHEDRALSPFIWAIGCHGLKYDQHTTHSLWEQSWEHPQLLRFTPSLTPTSTVSPGRHRAIAEGSKSSDHCSSSARACPSGPLGIHTMCLFMAGTNKSSLCCSGPELPFTPGIIIKYRLGETPGGHLAQPPAESKANLKSLQMSSRCKAFHEKQMARPRKNRGE